MSDILSSKVLLTCTYLRYAIGTNSTADQKYILKALPLCTTEQDFDTLPPPLIDETRTTISATRDKVLVFDKLDRLNSDQLFRALHKKAIHERTKHAVAQTHLAWIRRTYGTALPEAILIDPPKYLVHKLRDMVLKD